MTAFLKIDRCKSCHQETPWEWVPPVPVGGNTLAGTGVWRSALVDGLCIRCVEVLETKHQRERRAHSLREEFTRLVGGTKPYREFTLDRYRVAAGNTAAFEAAKRFDASKDNLYLWGPCGVGKTHLAIAILRRSFGRGASGAVTTPFQLIRQLRMKPPEEEQRTVERFIRVSVLVLDDMGVGTETTYARQALQEILDGRDFDERGGLVVTSQHPPEVIARRMGNRAIASRLLGLCDVIELRGADRRVIKRSL
jgi:DNA replication protein DnaC